MKAKNKPSIISTIVNGLSKLFKVNPKFSWLLIIVSILSFIPNMLSSDPSAQSNPIKTEQTWISSIGTTEIFIITVLASLVFVVVVAILLLIQGMVSYTTYQAIKNNTPTVKEAYQASKAKFWILLEVEIRVVLKVFGGLLLLIVPGIRAMCRYYMAPVAVFEQNTSAKEVMEFSKIQTKDNLLMLFVLMILASILSPVSAFIQYGGQVGIYQTLNNLKKGNN